MPRKHLPAPAYRQWSPEEGTVKPELIHQRRPWSPRWETPPNRCAPDVRVNVTCATCGMVIAETYVWPSYEFVVPECPNRCEDDPE